MEENTDSLSNKDIVLYALYLLGGWQKRVHTEDITLECYKLAPSKFSWVKYPQYPDTTTARHALEKCGVLVKGESERKRTIKNVGGWMLTTDGVQWVNGNKERIEKYLGKHKPIGDRLRSDRKIKELFKSAAFRKFRDSGNKAEVSHAEFAESLVCTVNTSSEVLNDRLEQLSSISEELKREEVIKYIKFCRKKFALLLVNKGDEKNEK